MADSIWITWERQRRSIELSKEFQTKLFEMPDMSSPYLRYLALSLKTLLVLVRESPKTVFAQNPSLILAFLLCCVKKIFKFRLVIDRHSNFKFDKNQKALKWRLFNFISNFTIRKADLTIVTNDYLLSYINKLGGNGYVLQDKLPELNLGSKKKLQGGKNVVFVSSFSDDEPLEEVIGAFRLLGKDWYLYITGKKRNSKQIPNKLSPNIILTGYLPDRDYQSLLLSCDVVLVLTKQEHTLTCGAYECVYLRKPFVASSTDAITKYFSKGVVYCEANRESIYHAIRRLILENDNLEREIKILKDDLIYDWKKRFNNLVYKINGLQNKG